MTGHQPWPPPGKRLRVRCHPVRAKELQPGDLFSRVGPLYWKQALNSKSIGEKLYVRTETPAGDVDGDTWVYRIEIVKPQEHLEVSEEELVFAPEEKP